MGTKAAANAAIYVRISRDKTGAGLGVERQEGDCRKLAKRLGWKVQKVYCDNDISAYSGKRRPQYEALLDDIEAGVITGVLAWHNDRLHRQPIELERYVTLSEQHGVTTHTVQAGEWNLSTAAGLLNARNIGNFAAYESRLRAERIKAAAEQRAVKRGGWSGGRRCYGWEKDGMTPREAEAAELRKAAEQIAEGVSLRAVVADLNARKVPTTNGRRPWDSTTLREALISPRQAGLCSHRGEVVGEAEWPAIIAPDVWHAVHRILTDPARRTNHVGGAVKWLGSGIYICGVCKSRDVRARQTTDRRKRYRCRNRIKGDATAHVGRDADLLDAYVEATLVGRLSDPKVLRRISKALDRGRVDAPALRAELAECRRAMQEASEDRARLLIDRSQLISITQIARARIEEIEAELAHAGTQSPLARFTTAEDVGLVWFGPGGPDGDRTGGLSLGARREVLQLLCDVTIQPVPFGRDRNGAYFKSDYIDIDWKAPAA
jgi:site-specific DNA recombinase